MTDKEYYDKVWQQCCNKVLALLVAMVAFGWLMMLAGCKSKESIVQAQIIHDSVFVARDSVVYRLVKDSVVERQQTTSTANGDTIYIDRLREVERWKIRTDTIRLVQYLKEKSDSTRHDEVVRTEQRQNIRKPPNVPWGWLVAGILAAILYVRIKRN